MSCSVRVLNAVKACFQEVFGRHINSFLICPCAGISINLCIVDDLPVLINLLINATKFTSQGSITLQLEQQTEDTALFSVTDTGTGIPKEKQKKIFNRFEKLNENAQGTGLGLSICQLIIEQLGGSIWIDPDYEEGSRFLFTHPIDKSDQGKEETR